MPAERSTAYSASLSTPSASTAMSSGAPRADAPGRADAGSVYVVFGRADAATVDLASLGSAGTRIDGAIAGDAAGTALSAPGDLNGDGRADLLIGAPGADPAGASGAGSAYVVFGTAAAGTIDLASLGSAGFRIDGAAAGDALGSAVAAPGDVDADGRPDVLVGAPEADRNGRAASGSAYVVHSPVGGTTVSTASLGSQGYVIDGAAAGDRLGTSVAAGGDVDGAGLADMVLGAPGADPSARADAGAAAVVFGLAGSANVDMASPGARGRVISGAVAGDGLGTRVAIAGDQNGTGPQDIAVSRARCGRERPHGRGHGLRGVGCGRDHRRRHGRPRRGRLPHRRRDSRRPAG